VARTANFSPPLVSTGIDLIFIYARTGQPERAAPHVPEVAQALPKVYGSHRWLWENRFVQARAELALARGEWEPALTLADEAIRRSRATGRLKYEAAGRVTRAQALLALKRQPEALPDLQGALALARALGDPFALGWNLAGARDLHVTASFLSHHALVHAIWNVQVAGIVAAHLAAVFVAHVLALRRHAHTRAALASQLPMTALMVGYTVFGLWLLSTPVAG